MAVFKCKMCGGTLEIKEGESVAVCEYCGTQQTLPKSNDETVNNLFNRANNLRLRSEFDKAEQIYEKILEIDNTEAEAHWGVVLCKYGIEYVEDPKTYKRVPTCHRTSFEAITADAEYLAAIQYADGVQRSVYEAEAKAIDKIQKDILSIVKNEKPFDVFICYKETDESGKRTIDSTIANDIYHQLTQSGFKVFYAAITLEDKLGQEYEPYIFAALNSAKVMLVIGTKPQYFEAVWVKNEWSRYLKLMKRDGKKLLIPCYRDMDAYDLPEEFAHLQAQDMSKIGFINDIVRGIKKVAGEEPAPAPAPVQQTVVMSGGSANTESLLTRAFMFLESGKWDSADEYCEKVLDIEPKNAIAYLGKLMAELNVRKKEKLADCPKSFEYNDNYQNTVRFSDDALKNELRGYIKHIRERNELERKTNIYNDAVKIMREAKTEEEFKSAVRKFKEVPGFKDADDLAKQCLEKAESARKDAIYDSGISSMKEGSISGYEKAISVFEKIPDWRDSKDKIKSCKKRIENIEEQAENDRKDRIYNCALDFMYGTMVSSFKRAIEEFEKIPHWRDSDERIKACELKIKELDAKAEAEKIKEEKRQKKILKLIAAFAVIAVAVAAFLIVLKTVILPAKQYNEALSLVENGSYYEAIKLFDEMGNYKDSKEKAVDIRIKIAYKETLSAGDSHTVGLKSDGTVVAVGEHADGRCDVSDWTDIVSVSAGLHHTVGLKSDGTVVAVGEHADGRCDVSDWTDIVSVSAGGFHTVGLKSDGTVVAVGYNNYGRCDVSNWTDIIAVSAGDSYTVGLKSDGTVVAVGKDFSGQCDVSSWKDIVAFSAGGEHTVGLKSDGTVVAVGDNDYGRCDVSNWTDIVSVSAGWFHTVGLKSDGTVVAVGNNDNGECNVSGWKDIVAISVGDDHTVGLKSDGTVVAVGENDYGECDVSDWKNIKTE